MKLMKVGFGNFRIFDHKIGYNGHVPEAIGKKVRSFLCNHIGLFIVRRICDKFPKNCSNLVKSMTFGRKLD